MLRGDDWHLHLNNYKQSTHNNQRPYPHHIPLSTHLHPLPRFGNVEANFDWVCAGWGVRWKDELVGVDDDLTCLPAAGGGLSLLGLAVLLPNAGIATAVSRQHMYKDRVISRWFRLRLPNKL